jgi:DNA repair exonuclease SbcCD ATPase subunit
MSESTTKTTGALTADILVRLSKDPKPDAEREMLVLAALEGPQALAAYLDASATPHRPETPSHAATTGTAANEPLGAYLKSITVEGFRGIGQRKTLDLPPGPGLTLVVGRNGSGKSSFAEALELLVTGFTYRWANRAKVWQQGWRNLHHKTAAVEAEFLLEGEKGATKVATAWKDDADLADAETHAQIHGKPRMDPAELGWEQALATYRPFLSYNELGSMLDEGPSKLFDALSAILGLDDLTEAQTTLADARKARESAQKQATQKRDEILGLLRAMDDDRARALVAALQKKDGGLDEADKVIAEAATGASQDDDVQLLRQLATLQAPTAEATAALARDLKDAHARQKAAAGTLAAKSKDLAEVLDHALRFHEQHGDGDCPVCGKKAALDAPWQKQKAREVERLRDAAKQATEAEQAAEGARKRLEALPSPAKEALTKATAIGIDTARARKALDDWREGQTPSTDLDALARHIEQTAGRLEAAVKDVRDKAQAELQHREDKWKPIARPLRDWLEQARQAQKGAQAIKPLKAAEGWLKDKASEIRNERFAPIKEKAQEIWSKLRLQSNVALQDIQLTGSATKRQVDLKVTVDDVPGAALGVMSQGEQNALALSLFIPRATLAESPFRFVVIDDPVQSMDPARIDGLARVLQDTAKKRQVVVFTHDDRLPQAARRLAIEATVIEVTRREGSAVELRRAKDPVARYIEDALALAKTDSLPEEAARRVIPGLCRLALEAACTEAIRRRRLTRGEPHAAVEDLLAGLSGTKSLAALALFDDEKRAGDVLGRLNKEGREVADTFRAVNEGAHEALPGPPLDLVRSTEKLAGWLQKLQ